MARGLQLTLMVDKLRAEIGHSLSAALGVNFVEIIRHRLWNTQDRLWRDWDWKHLEVDRDIIMAAGSLTYGFPSDLDQERISSAYYRSAAAATGSGGWTPVGYGIGVRQYNQIDSTNTTVRAELVRRWKYFDPNQIEVWPRPASDGGILRLHGIRNLEPFLDDADVSDLDGMLIVYYLAAEMLADQRGPRAQLALPKAQQHFATCKGFSPASNTTIILGGGGDPEDCAVSYPQQRELEIH